MEAVDLPPAFVKEYATKPVAFTGWEVNVVRRDNVTGAETSVPCTESYNHHYGAHINSASVRLLRGENPHGALDWELVPGAAPLDSAGIKIPRVQAFNEHNGNEARQSYHGLPSGYVQPIIAPASFVMSPMQINTNNPDTPNGGARGGPLPKESHAPPDAEYSGILASGFHCTTPRAHSGSPDWLAGVPLHRPG